MKNLVKLVGIITFIVIIGFSMTACDDGNVEEVSALEDTTWDAEFNKISYLLWFDTGTHFWLTIGLPPNYEQIEGTYSVSDSTVTLTMTINGEKVIQTGELSGNTLSFANDDPKGPTFTKVS